MAGAVFREALREATGASREDGLARLAMARWFDES